MYDETGTKDLTELLGQIHRGEAVLPDFQRDFVWDSKATRELIISIVKGFPAGSILRIRNTKNLFSYRQFQGVSPLQAQHPTFLVLDGQQRLTSLYQAFYGAGQFRYFLNLQKLLDGEDFDECVFSLRASRPQARRYSNIDNQAKDLIFPLSVLIGEDSNSEGFSDWKLRVSQTRYPDNPCLTLAMIDNLQRIENKWMKAISKYRFPVFTLSDSTDIEAICTIFETLNRTGVKLTVFDLLTARFWPQGINLREEWDKARQEHLILGEMEVDPYYLLQALSLCSRQTPGCKRGEVLSLSGDSFRKWWPVVVQGYANALEILRDDCGVIAPKWLPYAVIPIPMAAVLANARSMSGPIIGANRKKLVRWYWCSVLGQTYDNPPNSQAAKDFGELRRWLGDGTLPESISKFSTDSIGDFRDITFRQRALYRGLMGLVLRNRPRDFHKGNEITSESMRGQNIDDHHIFPDAYLSESQQGYSPGYGDHILNRTLIDSETNRRIGKNPPSVYIPAIEKTLGESTVGLLRSHLCSIDKLKTDNFEAFITDRDRKMRTAIAAATS